MYIESFFTNNERPNVDNYRSPVYNEHFSYELGFPSSSGAMIAIFVESVQNSRFFCFVSNIKGDFY